MNSSYNYANLGKNIQDSEDGCEAYDYYATETVQQATVSESVATEPGIDAILFTGNKLRSIFY